jgi:hypothetical protein
MAKLVSQASESHLRILLYFLLDQKVPKNQGIILPAGCQ